MIKLIKEIKFKGDFIMSKEREKEENFSEEALLISVRDDMEAKILESKLNAYGVPTLIKYRGSGQFLSFAMATTIYGVDIYVPAELLQEAKDIIS